MEIFIFHCQSRLKGIKSQQQWAYYLPKFGIPRQTVTLHFSMLNKVLFHMEIFFIDQSRLNSKNAAAVGVLFTRVWPIQTDTNTTFFSAK